MFDASTKVITSIEQQQRSSKTFTILQIMRLIRNQWTWLICWWKACNACQIISLWGHSGLLCNERINPIKYAPTEQTFIIPLEIIIIIEPPIDKFIIASLSWKLQPSKTYTQQFIPNSRWARIIFRVFLSCDCNTHLDKSHSINVTKAKCRIKSDFSQLIRVAIAIIAILKFSAVRVNSDKCTLINGTSFDDQPFSLA